MLAHENQITTLNHTIIGLTDVIDKYKEMENEFKDVQQNYSKLQVKISLIIYSPRHMWVISTVFINTIHQQHCFFCQRKKVFIDPQQTENTTLKNLWYLKIFPILLFEILLVCV